MWIWQVTCRCGYKSGWYSSRLAHVLALYHTLRKHPYGLTSIGAKEQEARK